MNTREYDLMGWSVSYEPVPHCHDIRVAGKSGHFRSSLPVGPVDESPERQRGDDGDRFRPAHRESSHSWALGIAVLLKLSGTTV